MTEPLLRFFPNLKSFTRTSPATEAYNCVAWALGETHRWWWPGGDNYWPPGSPPEASLAGFQAIFQSQGYVVCGGPAHEEGFERVAIYVGLLNRPSHVARQLPNGRWTSKLGGAEDIEHDLDGLTGLSFGQVALVMRRPLVTTRRS